MTYAVTDASKGAVRPAAACQVSSRTVFAVRASAVGSATGPIRPWCCQVQFDVSVDPTAFIPRTFSVSSGFISISPGAPRATPQEYFTALQAKGPYERPLCRFPCAFRKPSLMRPPYQAADLFCIMCRSSRLQCISPQLSAWHHSAVVGFPTREFEMASQYASCHTLAELETEC